MKDKINKTKVSLWFLLGIFLCINIIGDAYMTDQALSRGGFYETNEFTNIVGVQAHMLLLLGVAALLTINSKKHPICKFLLITACVIWSINNLISIGLLL